MTEPPTGSARTVAAMLPLPEAAGQVPPPAPAQVQVTPVSCAGMVSVTVTLAAADGPALLAVIV